MIALYLSPEPTADERLRFRDDAGFAARCRVVIGRAVLLRRHIGQRDASTRAELLAVIRADAGCGESCHCGYCNEAEVSALRQAIDLFLPPTPDDYPEEAPR
jgi:ribosomal protein L34